MTANVQLSERTYGDVYRSRNKGENRFRIGARPCGNAHFSFWECFIQDNRTRCITIVPRVTVYLWRAWMHTRSALRPEFSFRPNFFPSFNPSEKSTCIVCPRSIRLISYTTFAFLRDQAETEECIVKRGAKLIPHSRGKPNFSLRDLYVNVISRGVRILFLSRDVLVRELQLCIINTFIIDKRENLWRN